MSNNNDITIENGQNTERVKEIWEDLLPLRLQWKTIS